MRAWFFITKKKRKFEDKKSLINKTIQRYADLFNKDISEQVGEALNR